MSSPLNVEVALEINVCSTFIILNHSWLSRILCQVLLQCVISKRHEFSWKWVAVKWDYVICSVCRQYTWHYGTQGVTYCILKRLEVMVYGWRNDSFMCVNHRLQAPSWIVILDVLPVAYWEQKLWHVRARALTSQFVALPFPPHTISTGGIYFGTPWLMNTNELVKLHVTQTLSTLLAMVVSMTDDIRCQVCLIDAIRACSHLTDRPDES